MRHQNPKVIKAGPTSPEPILVLGNSRRTIPAAADNDCLGISCWYLPFDYFICFVWISFQPVWIDRHYAWYQGVTSFPPLQNKKKRKEKSGTYAIYDTTWYPISLCPPLICFLRSNWLVIWLGMEFGKLESWWISGKVFTGRLYITTHIFTPCIGLSSSLGVLWHFRLAGLVYTFTYSHSHTNT